MVELEARRSGSLFRLERKTRFPPELERRFLEDYRRESLPMVRMAFALGIGLYAIFGILDAAMAPKTKELFWLIRFGIVCPALAIALVLSLFPFFARISEAVGSVVALLAGFGIIAMIAFSKDANVTSLYYAGLILVLIYAYTFTRMRFAIATASCWALILGYDAAAVFLQRMLEVPELRVVFINNNFFFIAANVMGMIVCFYIESYARSNFQHRLEIARKARGAPGRAQRPRREGQGDARTSWRWREAFNGSHTRREPERGPRVLLPADGGGGRRPFRLPALRRRSEPGGVHLHVSGHGVPAAMIAAMLKSAILQADKQRRNPAMMLSYLNDLLIGRTNFNFVTAFYGVLDREARTLTYSNAGHPPPYLFHEGKVVEVPIRNTNLPIGIMSGADMAGSGKPYRNYRVSLPSASKLMFYTDGLIEARSLVRDGEVFGDLLEAKIIEDGPLPASAFVKKLYDQLLAFRGGDQFDDDICVIGLDVE